jgi:hypothetical protein
MNSDTAPTTKTDANDSSVLLHKIERFRKAPRRWSYWIAAFTALNGLLVATSQDLVFLVGLIAPFSGFDATLHFLAAGCIAAVASYERGPGVALAAYAFDLLWAIHLAVWAGVAAHAVVLALVAIAWNSARFLEQQRSASRISQP